LTLGVGAAYPSTTNKRADPAGRRLICGSGDKKTGSNKRLFNDCENNDGENSKLGSLLHGEFQTSRGGRLVAIRKGGISIEIDLGKGKWMASCRGNKLGMPLSPKLPKLGYRTSSFQEKLVNYEPYRRLGERNAAARGGPFQQKGAS